MSPTAGTIFDKTRTPLTVWFEAAWLMTTSKSGTSAANLARVTGMGSYQTAWALLARYRSVMVVPDRDRLSGVVEADESYFGGQKKPGKAGRGAAGKIVVAGAIERAPGGRRGFGRARLGVIEDASAASIGAFVTNSIAPGSNLVTDAWTAYPGVALTNQLAHERINISRSGLAAHELLPGVHRLFSLAKRWLEGTHQGGVAPEHLQSYLDEFIFRFNRRNSRARGLLFLRLLERSVAATPVTYRSLVKTGGPKKDKPKAPATRGKPGTLAVPPLHQPWRT